MSTTNLVRGLTFLLDRKLEQVKVTLTVIARSDERPLALGQTLVSSQDLNISRKEVLRSW